MRSSFCAADGEGASWCATEPRMTWLGLAKAAGGVCGSIVVGHGLGSAGRCEAGSAYRMTLKLWCGRSQVRMRCRRILMMMMIKGVCCSQVVLHVESQPPAEGSRRSGLLAAWNRASELRKNVLMLRRHSTHFTLARVESNFFGS